MPSLRLRTHIILLCIVTVYLSTVEGLNIILKDVSYSDFNRKSDAVLVQLLKKLQSEKIKKYKQKQNEVKTLNKLLERINHSKERKRDLRDDSFGSVRNFLDKLNNLINQNTHKEYYKKRDDCRFGFGPPGSCKNNKFRRYFRTRDLINRSHKDKLDYAKHMLVERAKYRSSSESDSDYDTRRPHGKQKSRFEIIDNKKKSKRKPKEGFEHDSDDKTLQMDDTDDSAEPSSEEPERIVNDDAESEETRKEVSDDSGSIEKGNDEKYLYLQGTRLQRPNARARQTSKKTRRGYRLPYFMPKRFKWDDNMLTHLDEYWNIGIRTYDTYRQKYEKQWPYTLFRH